VLLTGIVPGTCGPSTRNTCHDDPLIHNPCYLADEFWSPRAVNALFSGPPAFITMPLLSLDSGRVVAYDQDGDSRSNRVLSFAGIFTVASIQHTLPVVKNEGYTKSLSRKVELGCWESTAGDGARIQDSSTPNGSLSLSRAPS